MRRRLAVKPGITGLWQVNGRSDLTWDESVRLDLRYVENWSLVLDLQILWKTWSAVARGVTAPTSLCRLRTRPAAEGHLPDDRPTTTAWPVTWPPRRASGCSRCAPRAATPAALRKAGDRQSHEFLAAELARLRPGDAVLSEEGRDDPARLTADRVWIVDPLDGTREFGEPGRTDWAVHVALWERGELTAGRSRCPPRAGC